MYNTRKHLTPIMLSCILLFSACSKQPQINNTQTSVKQTEESSTGTTILVYVVGYAIGFALGTALVSN